ncbi:SDR family oxidoreductase [Fodinibius salsisoli]|uniref:SDR family oxidoreductase n=1 Tax=Fodinibius salsisoli TaxID=2820877 RepID=A0ABT3PMI2_9BACT|nr:SDR family oxidoreductase [Fodinibius salsisoli]MCW9707141.1 SDR family oxidoreductase [Fodinibius salsisoli]
MDLSNKLCVVTGANSGIGKETVRAFARQGAYVVMICRNEQRAEQARQEIMEDTNHTGLEIVLADLALQYDIRKAAETIKDKFDHIDILVNNAGFIPHKRQETADGIEKTLAVNHLAPFLLTNLLYNHLKESAEGRVITVSSEAHRLGAPVFDFQNLQLEEHFAPMKAYGLSKLCNIMFTHQLANRAQHNSVTANCLHPGVVRTQLAEEASLLMKAFYFLGTPFMKSAKRGAQTSIYLATSDEVKEISGKYFKNKKVTKPASIAYDRQKSERLWKISAELTGLS